MPGMNQSFGGIDMKYLLEREIRLEKSKYEALYDWALQEYDKNGKE